MFVPQRSSLSPPHSHESPQHGPLLRGQASFHLHHQHNYWHLNQTQSPPGRGSMLYQIPKHQIPLIIIITTRAREPVTRVAARPTLPRSLLVTHHPSAHHRARDQGDHHYNRSSKECAHLNGKKKGLTQCTSTETQTLAPQLAPPLFQAQPTTGCDDKEEMIIVNNRMPLCDCEPY